jgi:perosamine synthetase
MIPLAVPNLCGNEKRYLQECVATNYVSSVGPFVDRLEEMVTKACECNRSVATSSGTTGLHLALTAAGVRHQDLVILPSFTFIASANAIAHCGASPWLFDITEGSWTLDPDQLYEQLKKTTNFSRGVLTHTKTGRRVAAILPVYTLGLPADMDAIRSIATEFELPVIADAAAALGARYRGRNIGDLADISVCSFNGNKTITCGGGGALFGNNIELLEKAYHLSTTARRGAAYDHDEVGFNYRLTNIQAAVGCAQMEQLEQFVARKREIHTSYTETAEGISGIKPFPAPGWAQSACWFSGVVLDVRLDPDNVLAGLRERGIGARPFWKPVHMQAPYRNDPKAIMDVSKGIWRRIVTLPCSTSITEDEIKYVMDSVGELIQ